MKENPETIIHCLAHGIEALTKRLWPEEDWPKARSGHRSLIGMFNAKMDSAIESEKRFASIAIALYKSYRNPAAHNADQFSCKWLEATFFFFGMRVLYDLCRELQSTK